METSRTSEKALLAEIERLRLELEQARTAGEDAQAEVSALAHECNLLRNCLQTEVAARKRAEMQAHYANQHAADAARGSAVQGRFHAESSDVALRNALEEVSVLAEELHATNDALLRSNEELEARIAERTAALEAANAKLEALNKELVQRIDKEIAARSRAQADLFQMQKLDAVGQLTGGIAHDFNNLLGVVISGLELLAKLPQHQHERVLRRTEEAAWRGTNLTQRLLTFARRQVLQPGRIDVTRQIENLRELFDHSLRENINVRTDVPPGLWPAEADLAALELALLNLAVNARDAMPDGGTITLTACNRPMDERAAQQRGVKPGDYVELAVVDDGPGMPETVVQRAFEPFFTTKGAQGTGLGLAQVYGFAKQSGGVAWVESEVGQGTAVRLLLPRSSRPVPPPVAPVRLAAAPSRSKTRLNVLVVEDNDDLAAAVVDMLGQLGHRGTRVITMAAALAVLTGDGAVDLVFSDVLLPDGGSGLDLAREISRRNLKVPMILTSGYGGGMTQRLATANIPFLRKPYGIEALREAIRRALPAAAEIAEALPDR